MSTFQTNPDTGSAATTTTPSPPLSGPIVVGVDWPSGSQTALSWAAQTAQVTGAKIFLVHTISPIVGSEMAVPPFDYDEYRDLVRARVDSWGERLGDLDHEAQVFEDHPANGILGVSEEVGSGLIVVGAHARGNWEPPLLGSVTSKILHASNTPVAVVPDEPLPDVSAPVVVGVDGSPHSERALRWAATSEVTGGKSIYAVTVIPPELYAEHPHFAERPLRLRRPSQPEQPIHGRSSRHEAFDFMDIAGDTAADLRELADIVASDTGVKITADTLIGSPVGRLIETARDASVIVLGKSGHNALVQAILGSTGRGVATHSQIPVIFIP